MSDCAHEVFTGTMEVTRLNAEEGGPITDYTVDVTIKCQVCNLPFRFKGLEGGLSRSAPRGSPDREQARLPIEPSLPDWAMGPAGRA